MHGHQASGAIAKFTSMPRKLKFYQKKNGERLKMRKLQDSAKTEDCCQDNTESDDMFADILMPWL